MSFAQTFNALQNNGLTKGQKLVLAVVGTFADAAGKCWPSIDAIAARCSMAVRTVQCHIAALAKAGYLVRIYRTGRSAITRLTAKALGRPTPADSAPLPPQILHPEPVTESVNQITAQTDAPVLTEVPAVAAVVVFESVNSQQPEPAEPLPEPIEAATAPADPLQATTLPEPAITTPAPVTAPIDAFADVPAELLNDLGLVRKAKKKPSRITNTEAIVFASEASKAGLTVAQAVRECVLRGWSRFESHWLPTPTTTAPPKYYVPEVQVPATPSVKAAGLAAIAALRERIANQPKLKGSSVLT